MKKITFNTLCIAAALAWSAQAHAQNTPQPTPAAVAAPAPAADLTEGEVRKVDKENQKITLRHGDIQHLDMPGMTMVFRVKDAALLDHVKTGDKVAFVADRVNGVFWVNHLQITP